MMTVRWCGEYDRVVISMFHGGDSDLVIAARIPEATAHSIELRRSTLGLNRRYGGGDDLVEFGRRLLAAAKQLDVSPWQLFAVCSAKDLADIATARRGLAALSFAARHKTPFLEVAGPAAAGL